jgi:hypothetical protein
MTVTQNVNFWKLALFKLLKLTTEFVTLRQALRRTKDYLKSTVEETEVVNMSARVQ